MKVYFDNDRLNIVVEGGWTLSADKKTLTVTAKVSSQTDVALIGLTVLGVPTNVTNGTSVSVLVKGN